MRPVFFAKQKFKMTSRINIQNPRGSEYLWHIFVVFRGLVFEGRAAFAVWYDSSLLRRRIIFCEEEDYMSGF